MECGLDSLGAVELSNSIAAAFSLSLPPTFTFDYPTVNAMATFITSQLQTSIVPLAQGQAGQLQLSRALSPLQHTNAPAVQIAGTACRYPGQGGGVGSFWQTAVAEDDVQRAVPRERWDMDAVYAPDVLPGGMSTYTRWGSRLLLTCCHGLPLKVLGVCCQHDSVDWA